MTENLVKQWLRRYKLFFLIGLIIFGIQIFLAYKSQNLQSEFPQKDDKLSNAEPEEQKLLKKPEVEQNNVEVYSKIGSNIKPIWGIQPSCEITSKEALSALQRAKTLQCKQQIANITCAIQNDSFYPKRLESLCPAYNYTSHKSLGCYKDNKDVRILSSYSVNLKHLNSPHKCIALCLQSGYPYAGTQYGKECFCGSEEPNTSVKLADSSCNIPCTGDPSEVCGGYYTMNVYETGIASNLY